MSWNEWVRKNDMGGGCILDLHTHDTDLVNYLFGLPEAVHSRGARSLVQGSDAFDYVSTTYDYGENGPKVIAQANWHMQPGYFEMGYTARFENAVVFYTFNNGNPVMSIAFKDGKTEAIELEQKTGWEKMLSHHIACIAKGIKSDVVSPESALDSLRIVLAEIASAEKSPSENGWEVEVYKF